MIFNRRWHLEKYMYCNELGEISTMEYIFYSFPTGLLHEQILTKIFLVDEVKS